MIDHDGFMALVWRCTTCGHTEMCKDDLCHKLPDKCPSCNAPREELEVVEED